MTSGLTTCGITTIPKYLRGDVGEYRQLERVVTHRPFELVYHLAAEFGRWNGEDFYETMWQSNVIGTKNLLRLQEKHIVPPDLLQQLRGLRRLRRRHVRGRDGSARGQADERLRAVQVGQRAADPELGSDARNESVRVRLFNTYGPGEPYSIYRSVICRFVYSALHDLPYTVYNGHTRTSTYITDMVFTLANIAERFKAGEVYNLAGQSYHDIKTASDLILAAAGKTDKLVTYSEGEPFTTKHKKVDAIQGRARARTRAQGRPRRGNRCDRQMDAEFLSVSEQEEDRRRRDGLRRPAGRHPAGQGRASGGRRRRQRGRHQVRQRGLLHIDEDRVRGDDRVARGAGQPARHARRPRPADAFLIAVPTPLEFPRKTADLSMVSAACRVAGSAPAARRAGGARVDGAPAHLPERHHAHHRTSGLKVGKDILLAHCPERILPGRVFHEIVHNDRIIGGVDQPRPRRHARCTRRSSRASWFRPTTSPPSCAS